MASCSSLLNQGLVAICNSTFLTKKGTGFFAGLMCKQPISFKSSLVNVSTWDDVAGECSWMYANDIIVVASYASESQVRAALVTSDSSVLHLPALALESVAH
jgi:hypothetical protein